MTAIDSIEENVSLPPPSALFGSSDMYHTSSPSRQEPESSNSYKNAYMLPPPSSLPGFTNGSAYYSSKASTPPPPQITSSPYYASHQQPPPLYLPTPATTPIQDPTSDSSRKRKRTKKHQAQHTPYLYQVMELDQSKKKHKKEDLTVSAAAATLTSFTQSEDDDLVIRRQRKPNKKSTKQEEGCGDHEDCAGKGRHKCEQCGTHYQHGICLERHMWDHTKGLDHRRWGMSKRQQVQVLEAAQILMDIAKGIRISVLN